MSMKSYQIKSFALKAALVISTVIIILWFSNNVAENMAILGLKPGFDFLTRNTHFDVTSGFWQISRDDLNYQTIYAGLTNTIIVSIIGIILSTLLGFTVALMGLSDNWLMKKTTSSFVETFRNIPLVAQILFWYNTMLFSLPKIHQSINIADKFFLNNRGFYLPKITPSLSLILLIGSFTIIFYLQKKVRLKYGYYLIMGLLIFIFYIIPTLTSTKWFYYSYPSISGFNFAGGSHLAPEFSALLVGLTLYTSAYTAEAIRSGLQSVPKGQYEASLSLGLSYWTTLKKVIVPQAIPVIIPPLLNQYLNLTKNSSLGIVVAYPEIMAMFAGTVLNQTGNAIEIISITMAIYLTISLLMSMLINYVNGRYKSWMNK